MNSFESNFRYYAPTFLYSLVTLAPFIGQSYHQGLTKHTPQLIATPLSQHFFLNCLFSTSATIAHVITAKPPVGDYVGFNKTQLASTTLYLMAMTLSHVEFIASGASASRPQQTHHGQIHAASENHERKAVFCLSLLITAPYFVSLLLSYFTHRSRPTSITSTPNNTPSARSAEPVNIPPPLNNMV
jgi:hypothetical protein